jgi:hypothetical protein
MTDTEHMVQTIIQAALGLDELPPLDHPEVRKRLSRDLETLHIPYQLAVEILEAREA